MGKLGGSKHLRSLVAPEFWPIPVKERFWTVKPSPGPHPIEASIPLAILIRDMMRYATTLREARKIIAKGLIEVDGRVRRNYKYPVGLMDVLHIIPEEKYYRVVPGRPRKLVLVEIPPEEAHLKLLRVKRKTTVKGGHIQLTFHDGGNYLVRVKDPRNPVEAPYRTMDSVLFDLKTRTILEHIPFEPGVLSVVVDGRNVGFLGRIESVQQVFKRRDALVVLSGEGGVTRTVAEYVFPVGREKPLVTVVPR